MTDVLLITGANSYVAGHMIQQALERGYAVHGTVRSEASGQKLLAVFPQHATGADAKLTYAIVPDMTAVENYETSFRNADITGVIHTASPFRLDVEDNAKDLLEPARDGAVAILEAVRQYGNGKVRSVISVSSFASVVDMSYGLRPGYHYTEADWNPMSWDAAKTTDVVSAYCASKALAEKAQWAWQKEHAGQPGADFALTTMTPPWVFGPYVNLAGMGIKKPGQLNESMKLLAHLVDGSLAGGEVPPTDFAGFIDVRDLATAVLRAYDGAKAADPAIVNQRFLIASKFSYQTAADVIRDSFPDLRDNVPVGTPGAGRTEPTYIYDTSKAKAALGIKFTSIDDTVRDSVRQIATLL
ncbi:NAD dependent epimerase [Grosmannia clavigera kw1407]|uniref:NAD dependent epimerase n=1 Tax=Grosmannia clavigera (strain kw1407 / UAMH 11150) TaxID=655863 RepID=F0XF71_GROCL|nr:NAD dependent epimerase [Grosmannia clavigera kw1407]EFX03772.1 NAD dependent epimerase [Grosmannia clavigera kw1407]